MTRLQFRLEEQQQTAANNLAAVTASFHTERQELLQRIDTANARANEAALKVPPHINMTSQVDQRLYDEVSCWLFPIQIDDQS